jgi:serine protease Do
LVRGVEQGSPAEKAGLEPGDIILKFDGKPIEKSSDLPRMVGNTKPGTKSAIQVWRRGSLVDKQITVGEFEPEAPAKKAVAPVEKPVTSSAAKFLGLTVSDLTDAQKKELKLKSGVRVDAAADAAARAGLREGDIILSVGNAEVASARDLEAALAKHDKKKSLSVLFRRGDWTQFAVIKPVN